MRKKSSESIGQLLSQYLRQEGLETPLNERRAIAAWSSILGPAISSYTTSLEIRNQVLYVALSSSVLRQELMMQRRELVRRINEASAPNTISDIIFR